MPQLTIGLPVYNGAATLRRALDSLLSQTFGDFVLLISDNASQDSTPEICREYVARDSRVRYSRRPKTCQVFENIRSLLMLAETPYFMWAAHDDRWEPEFAEKNIAHLERNPHAVASVSMVSWISADGSKSLADGTRSISGTPEERLKSYIGWPSDNSRFYSVFRTGPIKKSFPENSNMLAFDWLVMALNLVEGEHFQYPEVLLIRQGQKPDHYLRRTFSQFEPKWYDWAVPLHRFNLELRRRLPKHLWRTIRWRLLLLNARTELEVLEVQVPPTRPLLKLLRTVGKAVLPRQLRSGRPG